LRFLELLSFTDVEAHPRLFNKLEAHSQSGFGFGYDLATHWHKVFSKFRRIPELGRVSGVLLSSGGVDLPLLSSVSWFNRKITRSTMASVRSPLSKGIGTRDNHQYRQ